MSKVRILNTEINAITASGLKDTVKDFLTGDDKKKIGKVNTEFLLRAIKDDEFQKVLDGCDINIADGKGVLWAAKYLSLPLTKIPILRQIQAIWQMKYTGASLIFHPKYCRKPISENIPGLDAMLLMLEAAEDVGAPVYFFGAETRVLPEAIEKIKSRYPKLKIAGYHDGYDYEDIEIVKDINKSGAKLLIVALGSPKQEYWIRDHYNQLKSIRLAVGEGGTLDFVAGSSKRAPKFMQKMGIEWLWRLFTGVNRTGVPGKRAKSRMGRVWNAVPVFIYNVVKFKLGHPSPHKATKGQA
jgi:N-acetylglucosaminyldiphosphoundecaprenol N-acetyl-beta-D-mannosaminyltransferase